MDEEILYDVILAIANSGGRLHLFDRHENCSGMTACVASHASVSVRSRDV